MSRVTNYSPEFWGLVSDAEQLLDKVVVYDPEGNLLFYNENWLVVNNLIDCKNCIGYIVESEVDWRDVLRGIREKHEVVDLDFLRKLCEEGEWPYKGD